MKKPAIYIGTSGWHYKHWIGTFYPAGLKEKDQLGYYTSHFHTVEINNSFYMLPQAGTFTGWKKATPARFLFAVKASRFITHMKKLKPGAASLRKLLARAGRLENKLGPILFQLPPGWKINLQRLQDFLEKLPKGYRYTFEFRNHTWHTSEVYQLLEAHNCAFCIYELEHFLSPLQVTAGFVYVRLHGPGNKYQGNYTTAQLKKWARQCRQWIKDKKSVYIYFDNDQLGYAAFNAKKLLQLVQL